MPDSTPPASATVPGPADADAAGQSLAAQLAGVLARQQALLAENQQLHAARQALAASEARLKAAEAVAGMGSYELDLGSGALHFSDGLYQLLGEAPGSFTPSLAWLDARSHPDDALAVRQVLHQAAQTSQPYHYTRRTRRADGQWRLLESHGRVVADAAGTAIRYEGVVAEKPSRARPSRRCTAAASCCKPPSTAPRT